MWVMLVLCVLHVLVLWRLVVVVGYLSDRHVLVLLLCSVYPAVAALGELPQRFVDWLRGWRHAPAFVTQRCWPVLGNARVWSFVLLLGLCSMGLPRALQPLHASRAGHRAAGVWLARHAQPTDQVEDDHCWAHYYSGRVFLEGKPQPSSPPPRTCYTVIGRARVRDYQTPRTVTEDDMRAQGRRIVYHWPTDRPVERALVVVYAGAAK
jgi:hypothetical protein